MRRIPIVAMVIFFPAFCVAQDQAAEAESGGTPAEQISHACIEGDQDACIDLGQACGEGSSDACLLLWQLPDLEASKKSIASAFDAYKASIGIDKRDSTREKLEKWSNASQANAARGFDALKDVERGDELFQLGKHDLDPEKFEEAIDAYQIATGEITRESNADLWARIQHRIVRSYLILSELEGDQKHLEAALETAKGSLDLDPSMKELAEKLEASIANGYSE